MSSWLHELSPDLDVVRVGDALAPRHLLDAAAEGARAGAGWPKPAVSSHAPSAVGAG